MNPIFGVVLSAIFLGENGVFDIAPVILSLLLVALGIIVVNYSRNV